MKINLLFIFALITGFVSGQCSFNPQITPSSLQLCPLQSDTLFSSPGSAYQWFKNGNPVSGANQNFLVVSQMQDANSSFVVAVTILGCTEASPAVSVFGYNFPAISIIIEDGADITACAGDTLYLRVNQPYVSNIKWYNNGIQLNNQFNDSLMVSGNGSFSVLAYTEECPSYGQLSQPLNVTFSPAIQPHIYEDVMEPELTLTTDVTAYSYTWFLEGEVIEGADSVNIQPVVNGVYAVEVLYLSGCTMRSENYIVNSIIIDCPQEPTVLPADLVLCPEQSDTLFTQAADSYQWYRQGLLIPGATDSFLVVSNIAATGSAFTVQSSFNSCAEFSDAVMVNVLAFSSISMTQSQDPQPPLCEGESVILNVGDPFSTNVSWTRNGIIIPGAPEDSLVVINSGIYAVTGHPEECPEYSQTSAPTTLTFELAPVPIVVFNENNFSLSTGVTAAVYNWYLNGELIAGISAQTITIDSSGAYKVEAVYANACSKSSAVLNVVISGIEDHATSGLNLYPNPVRDLLFLNINEKNAFLGIYSVDGKLQQQVGLNTETSSLDLSQFAPGIYFLKISADGKEAVRRIVKE